MKLIIPQVLSQIRSFAEQQLTDSCSILRPWSGSDGGYRKGGHQTVEENVPCRLMQQTQRDTQGMVMDREAGTTYWKLALPFNTDLRDGDSVLIGGVKYAVLQVYAANTDKVFVEAQLSLINKAARP